MHVTIRDEIQRHQTALRELCAELGVRRLELFGSAVDSPSPRDLDFLAALGERPPSEYAAAYFDLKERLEALFGRPVDLITPAGLDNPYFRASVEQQRRLLYAA